MNIRNLMLFTIGTVLVALAPRQAPAKTIMEIIDATADGTYTLDQPYAIAVDGSGNVYMAGADSDNAFKIAADGTIGRCPADR